MDIGYKVEIIKKMIGNNQIKECIIEIEKLGVQNLKENLIIIRRRIKENNDQFNMGLISLEDYNVSNARIALALLKSLDDLLNSNKNTLTASLCLNLGKQRMEEKDFLSAKMYFDKAIIENQFLIEAYLDRGAVKLALGASGEAIVDFSVVIKNDPSNPIAFYNRGAAYLQLGELSKACTDWKKVKALGYDLANELLKLCS